MGSGVFIVNMCGWIVLGSWECGHREDVWMGSGVHSEYVWMDSAMFRGV
jgi:hypothetical protein